MNALRRRLTHSLLLVWPLLGCSSAPPIAPVPHVDVKRFMGDWFVIASIPTHFEKDASNAVESYAMQPDGTIQTTFTYHEGSPGGPLKSMHPKGYVREGTNGAVWGMQFIWPIKAQYIIAWLDPDYRAVIVARDKRDYVWIMARGPQLDDATYQRLVARVAAMGYDVSQLRKVPQQWPAQASR